MDKQLIKQQLKYEFYPHLYQWALMDAKREAEQDFPWLSTMHHDHVAYHLEILRSFVPSERVDLFIALTKLSYQTSGEFSEIQITSREQKLLKAYQRKLNQYPYSESEVHKSFYTENNFFKANLANLNKLVSTELSVCFDSIKVIEKDYLEYQNIIDFNWNIATAVHLAPTGIQYTHLLSALPKKNLSDEERYQQRVVFSNPISLPRWLGFKGGVWIFFNEEDPRIAAKTIALACSHFLDALPQLLSGISSPL